MFLLLSALSYSEGIWSGLPVRSHCRADCGGHTDDFLEPVLSSCTERLVSFQFCCCLIQFECENKFESVSAFRIKFFCADTLQGFQGPDLQCLL